MREIKFRAWDEKYKEMVYVDLRFLVENFNRDNVSFGDGNLESYKWMQFTGLKDKNGKEIYEGDILDIIAEHSHYHKRVVEFSHRKMGFVLRKKHNGESYNDGEISSYSQSHGKIMDHEIIGNIWENPDLLNHPEK